MDEQSDGKLFVEPFLDLFLDQHRTHTFDLFLLNVVDTPKAWVFDKGCQVSSIDSPSLTVLCCMQVWATADGDIAAGSSE